MAKKQDVVARVIKAVQPRFPLPDAPLEGATLLEQGMYAILVRHLTPKQAEQTVVALRAAFDDWNELRVSQAQEIAPYVKTSSRRKGYDLLNDRKEACLAIKDYLQDVFQQIHGLEIEPILEDPVAAGAMINDFKVLGLVGGSWLLWVGGQGQVPVHIGLLKMLDKLGWIARTTSLSKGRDMIAAIVPKGQELQFTLATHEILERWADEENPIYAEVEALREVPAAKKAFLDWEQARKRAEAQRQREEARRIAAEKKEAERIRKEEEKERKRLEAEEKKREKELERKRKIQEKRLAAEKAKADAAKERERKAKEAARQKEAAKKAAAKKKEQEAKKKAAAKKKAEAKKKTAAKKAAVKKTASKKKAAVKKTASKKKATVKKAASKKKAAPKKAASKKAATKKKVSKKPATKKAAVKKTASKKKATPKKTASKKAAKKTARKR